ncbi:RNA polymerase sigma-70 factor [Pedobacter sp. MC2016-14]|uniref:RNA polymerase sigma-70 factor n=1 Tax=Pedobacter sp. MC2016-14 TaxID=2897327 RepID=UPI001E50D4A0|nr:RNA polymerase sigma-70 factor [Pedobacter sp. MC2016-14]MCD0490534.1 RNA polymerase sigma-70 factor [Pedobacter sp. MC2016-14]
MIDYSRLTDAELLSLLKLDEHAAFTEVYNRYWKRLLAIAYNHTKDKSAAEEITQEVFISLWNKRHTLEIQTLDRYLATGIKFTVFNMHYRKRKRISDMISKMPFQESYEIEEEIAARFLQEQIDGIVNKLPEKCRMVFKYSREQGLTIPQIGKEMNIADKTVEAHLTKALKEIKNNLSDTGAMLVLLAQFLHK